MLYQWCSLGVRVPLAWQGLALKILMKQLGMVGATSVAR